jgi:hypothetical protein
METYKLNMERLRRAKEFERAELGGGSFAQWRHRVYSLEVTHEMHIGSANNRLYPNRKAVVYDIPYAQQQLPPTDWDLPIEYVLALKMKTEHLRLDQAMQKVSARRNMILVK